MDINFFLGLEFLEFKEFQHIEQISSAAGKHDLGMYSRVFYNE